MNIHKNQCSKMGYWSTGINAFDLDPGTDEYHGSNADEPASDADEIDNDEDPINDAEEDTPESSEAVETIDLKLHLDQSLRQLQLLPYRLV